MITVKTSSNLEYAVAVENWLVDFQNENGHGIKKRPVEISRYRLGAYAFDEAELVGGITFGIQNCWVFVGCGFVLPQYRGRGIYRELLNIMEVFAKDMGIKGIFLSTYDFEAPELYPRFGFTRGSVLPDCPPGNTNIDYFKVLGGNHGTTDGAG